MSDQPERKRVAILGGGVASLSAALELTAHPDWRERYDVTVYQLGWRLGGKCATGRGAGGRIEEHGIHIMQGWYHNMYRLMSDVYAERQRFGLDPTGSHATWADAIEPLPGTILMDYSSVQGAWAVSGLNFPLNEERPGELSPTTPWQSILKLIALGAHLSLGFMVTDQDAWLPRLHRTLVRVSGVEHSLRRLMALASTLRAGDASSFRMLHGVLRTTLAALDAVVPGAGDPTRGQRMLAQIELLVVVLQGLLDEIYDEDADRFDFDAVNDLDFREWLARHGASRRVLDSAHVRFYYCGMFANLADGRGRGGLLAADKALRVLLLVMTYRGAWVSMFRRGTGETVVLPIYDVLRHRGVRFEFFQDVKQIHRSTTGAIERVSIEEQVTLKHGAYDPIVEVGGVRAWPSEPRWEQLDDGDAARLCGERIDLESPWARWQNKRPRVLERERDFDELILGIPVAALRTICAELADADVRWRRMLDGVKTTQTLAVQLWTKPTMAELGVTAERFGLQRGTPASTVVYTAPLVSWIDMASILAVEPWSPQRRPGGLAYLCGAIEDAEPTPAFSDHDFPERDRERGLRITDEWLRYHMGYFWPAAASREYPLGFDTRELFTPDPEDEARTGSDRLRTQYLRTNCEPSSRYTLAVPGSDRLRMRADESGYANLFLAGDWTDFGLNIGYIEGAFISGMRAAQALRKKLGCTAHSPIYADVPFEPRAREPAARPPSRTSHEALRTAIGGDPAISPALLDRLVAAGIDAASLPALQLAPLVVVAWADEPLDARAREAILQAAERAGVTQGSVGRRLLERWLASRPTELLEVWRAYVRVLASVLPPSDLAALKHDVLERAQTVAGAAGGLLGRGAGSRDGRKVMRLLAAAFE